MKKIVTVIGARPQFIKASVVSRAIAQKAGLQETVVHTGQHYDKNMSDVFFSELGMAAPAYHLGIGGGNHGEMTGRMLAEVEKVLLAEKPDALLVYGDTNSTLAGALAAAKLHIPVAHVEAGLRSFNRRMPEEINRVLTDHIARWLFAPTDVAREHLLREGIDEASIVSTGDVMYDVALLQGRRAAQEAGVLDRLGLVGKPFVLATVHRAENTDNPERLASIVQAFVALAADLAVVWPLHPRTRSVLQARGLLPGAESGVQVIDPVGYLDMVRLEMHAALIATDSGGVQKEAFFHRVPCVTLRDETEWVELIDAGWNRLAPPGDAAGLAQVLHESLGTSGADVFPYGHGDAATKIADYLASELATR